MLIDRHRVRQLIALSALEQTVQGPERLLREEDVAILIKAAYDDATAPARAAFMDRVKKYPESEWPWSAVKVAKPPMGGGGGGGLVIVAVPAGPKTPAVLLLLLGQAESADADPGDRLPARGSVEATPWEPLYKALDAWDVATIQKYIAPGGWMTPGGTMPIEDPEGVGQGGMNGAPVDDGGTRPGDQGGGGNGQSNGNGNGNGKNGGPPATQTPTAGVPGWVWGIAIAGGTALAIGTGVFFLRRRPGPSISPLEQELRRQAGGPR